MKNPDAPVIQNKSLLTLRLTVGLMLVFITCYLHASPPIATPARLGGIDTLAKMARLDALRADRMQYKEGIDKTQGTLIDDPRVIFSTYCGGNGYDCGNSLAVDSRGDVYIVGYTGSSNFPVSGDAWQKEKKGGHDMFAGKFTATGERVWLTYLGGGKTDVAVECIADKDDNLIIVGKTDSPDFPTTEGVEQPAHQGGTDVVLVKFSPDGKLLWSRYYGGYKGEVGEGIALCNNGADFVITGSTLSMNKIKVEPGLPITKGTYQDTLATYNASTLHYHPDAFLAKFDGSGKMIWGTFFGGVMEEAAHAVAVDKDDNIAIVGETYKPDIFTTPVFPTTPDAFRRDSCAGRDIFFSKFNPNGGLVYSTYYCGSTGKPNDETKYPNDYATDIKFDGAGSAVFCGYTGSKLFPTTPDAYKPKYDSYDAVLVKFSKDNKRIWGTYLGGASGSDLGQTLSIDSSNNSWVAGEVNSNDLDTSEYAIWKTGGPITSIFKFNSLGNPTWISYFWGEYIYRLAIESTNSFYLIGKTENPKFRVTKNAFQEDVYISKLAYTSYLTHVKLLDTNFPAYNNLCDFISIFPNPAKNTININNSENSDLRIILYNLLGQNIKEFTTKNNNNTLLDMNLLELPVGFYILEMSDGIIVCRKSFVKE